MSQYTEWSEALEMELSQPFPPEWVQEKRIKGNAISFVPWYRYAQRLNELVGPQNWSIPEPRLHTVGSRTVVFVGLEIMGVTKWDVGEEHHEVENKKTGEVEEFNGYGGPVLNAYAQAMKRAAAKFGLGLGMYDKSGKGTQPRPAPRTQPKPESASPERCRVLAGLVEQMGPFADKLNGEATGLLGEAEALAVAGGPKHEVENAIKWAEGIIREAKARAVA